jgi:hypothetical protein
MGHTINADEIEAVRRLMDALTRREEKANR